MNVPQPRRTPFRDGPAAQGSGAAPPAWTGAKNPRSNVATLAKDNLLAPNNPNSTQPFRLTPAQAVTCDQDHTYTGEQKADNGGTMDQFDETVSRDACSTPHAFQTKGLVMGYYDGNTVTGLWNYAQHYAMSDHAFSTVFGPSTPGALNLISGQTHGVTEFTAAGQPLKPTASDYTVRFPDANGVGTVINDPDPVYDDCSNNSGATQYSLAAMTGKNIGDLLNDKA